jgi:hypothetical protein
VQSNVITYAIGPAVVGMYMQANQISINGIPASFPSSECYIFIFSPGLRLSIIVCIVAMDMINKRASCFPNRICTNLACTSMYVCTLNIYVLNRE